VTRSDELLADVAGAILDGTPVDWSGLDSRTGEIDQGLVEQLKTLAALRQASRPTGEPHHDEHQSWGHLRVLERIGQGACGEVHRAWDTRLDREVALKLMPDPAHAGSPGTSIIEEGRLLARVRHPNVVTIYGAERIDGRIGLWMEFVHGRTLEEELRDGRTFSAKDVTRIGVELCRAVSAVHAAGLLHRDIKAQNVMAGEDGRLVLMDFGTGTKLGGAETRIAGTPLYLAPEVLAGAAATVQSDVYSIGVLLYHLLTNAYPVQARDLADLRRTHAAGERTSLRSARQDVPERLARVIDRALDPRPDRRFDTADALGKALAPARGAPASLRAAYVAAAVLAAVAVAWVAGLVRFPRPVIGSDRPMIAVLPFKNLSAEPDSDYFVDGLTEEVIRNFAVIDGLEVKSLTSSFFFKNKRDLAEIQEKLGVNLIVEGSVQRDDKRLRINAQLVQIAGDVPIWSARFDRPLEDLFAIQDEISRAIVNELRLTLGRGQRRYRPPMDAYDNYLRARVLLGRRGTENAQQAASLLEQVIAKDPSFTPAYAGLADAYSFMSWQIEALPDEEGLRLMRPAAVKAIELDPLLAEAQAAMGLTYARELDWENARRSFDRAIELNPSLTQVHTNYAMSTLLPLGQLNSAQDLLEAALARDPLALDVRRFLGFAQIVAGRYDAAIANLRHVLEVDPEFPFANLGFARALTFSGRPEAAVAHWEHLARSQQGWERWLTHAYVMSGRRAEAIRLAEAHRNEEPYRQALIYAALGDKDRTFEALDKAADSRPNRTAVLLVLPEMRLLRGDARLAALKRKLNLQ
jgi:TolB-like protein/Tfp pilus assembly protein PilF